MTRTHLLVRTVAGLVACGSFLALPAAAVPADQADPDETAQVSGSGASLGISPLRIEIEGSATGATVYLSNASTRELAVQSRIFAWAQDAGTDVYAPSGDLSVSPSISIIPPGETQIVRVLRKGPASPGEKRFRLAVDQLPDPNLARAGQAEARIRFTVPVFIDRDTSTPAALAWRIADDRLELANSGGATAKILGIAVTTAGGNEVQVERNSLRYIHGNSTISWPIGRGCSLGTVHVTAQIDGRTVDAQPHQTCG